MKLLLISACCFFSTSTIGQNLFPDQKPAASIDLLTRLRSNAQVGIPGSKDSLILKLKNTQFGKHPRVYSLPQDNMPCIVPDTKDLAAIPNVWPGKVERRFKSRIPNPYLPNTEAKPQK